MNNIFLYAHGGSGNHGCEAIVRSTLGILENIPYNNIILLSSNPAEDNKYRIDELCQIENEKNLYSKLSFSFLSAYMQLKTKKDYIPLDKLIYKKAFDQMKKGDIALSIGGDNYCYKDVNRYIMLHDLALKRETKTILWGCSIEPHITQDPKIKYDLARYSLITARESITYEAVKKINPNTLLVPDPAFTLKFDRKQSVEHKSDKKFVGINLSPLVQEQESIPGIVSKCYERLIEYIIDKTDLDVLLIPHVVWSKSDDRKSLTTLYERYKKSRRIHIIEDQDCIGLKSVISSCDYFIGARTHSTIAAYSTGVPTIVVGYSVKAKGIAMDLFGTDDNFVIPVQSIKNDDELLSAFKWIMTNENEIKEKLRRVTRENVLNMYKPIVEQIRDINSN